jgi:hypothetical protein
VSWGDFPEYQHHQGQPEGGNGDAEIPEQPDADDGRDGGGQDVDQIVADENEAKQAVRPGQQLLDPAGSLVLVWARCRSL